MGNMAAQMLLQHIESREAVTPRRVYLDPALVVRASASPPMNVVPLATLGTAVLSDSQSAVAESSEVGSLT
jgi:hypothetical protein